jgi:hypothetical protein
MPNDGGERIDGSYHVSRAARESGQRIDWALMCTFLLSFLTHSRQENQLAAALDPEPLKSNQACICSLVMLASLATFIFTCPSSHYI